MRRDSGIVNLQKTPSTPPCQKDRLFEGMKKYTRSPRATQLVPVYSEFRLGHGDPLMAAVMKHWNDMARPHPHRQHENPKDTVPSPTQGMKAIPNLSMSESENDDDYKEIHLIQHGSPLGGLGMNDIVHVGKNEVVDFPCLHFD